MSHFSLNLEPPNTLWYTPNNSMDQKPPYPFFYHTHNTPHNQFNNNTHNYDDADSDNSSSNAAIPDRSETASSTTTTTVPAHDKEHMFEKPLTPSDVGKLNRLVIPKQHAEKYLPLAAATAAGGGESSGVGVGGGGGGLLLGFEDETGKCWRFRYSYWNSSQSYVLTKGWSRYVKEKKLDAGDVVLFERHRFEPERFFIGWRRRGSNPPVPHSAGWTARSFNNNHNHNHGGYNSNIQYNNNHNHNNNNQPQQQNVVQSQQCYAAPHQISLFPNFPPDSLHGGSVQAMQKSRKSGGGKSKRVRLFGVNLDCDPEEEENQVNEDEPQTSDGSSLSSQGQGGQGFGSGSGMGPTSYNYFDYVGYPPNHHNHMDMNFTHDVNQQQMRNRLG